MDVNTITTIISTVGSQLRAAYTWYGTKTEQMNGTKMR